MMCSLHLFLISFLSLPNIPVKMRQFPFSSFPQAVRSEYTMLRFHIALKKTSYPQQRWFLHPLSYDSLLLSHSVLLPHLLQIPLIPFLANRYMHSAKDLVHESTVLTPLRISENPILPLPYSTYGHSSSGCHPVEFSVQCLFPASLALTDIALHRLLPAYHDKFLLFPLYQ